MGFTVVGIFVGVNVAQEDKGAGVEFSTGVGVGLVADGELLKFATRIVLTEAVAEERW